MSQGLPFWLSVTVFLFYFKARLSLLDKDLDDRFVEVEIETSELNRKRDLFQKNETTIKGLEENQQIIQNEYDLSKAEENELNEKLQNQLKFIGKETYRNIFSPIMILRIYFNSLKSRCSE